MDAEPFQPRTLKQETAERVFKTTLLIKCLHELLKEVNERVDGRREMATVAHTKATNIVTHHFFDGDFVLVCKAKRPVYKLSFI